MMDQVVFDTLLLALEGGAVPVPASGPILVLNAEPGPWLMQLPKEQLVCRTSFKPSHDALKAAGFDVLAVDSVDVPAAGLTIVIPPRQRDQARALYARALLAAPEGGYVLACLPNTLGGKTGEKQLAEISGEADSLSKHKCRAFWARKQASLVNVEEAEDWIAQDSVREIEPGLYSRPGLFSWDRVDPGSELLADSVPEQTKGIGADLGGGYGFLSREILTHCPGVDRIDLYEAEYRAIGCIEATLAPFEGRFTAHWADVLKDLPEKAYDFVVMNPPFHTGRADNSALGRGFIRAASQTLKPGGTLWLVANRHLPYEAELSACFKEHEMLEDEAGYKIIRAARPKRPK
ncbi:MAG: class I SAM-dependent methyltransferase [Acidobacteria bacterium]|jgi:16S rRNA (guanine1207-N2)-methyltransferase|nr:class I SAM-dependent methyltransferase [Acidobacteriota bacterium]